MTGGQPGPDQTVESQTVESFRDEIAALDLRLVSTVNARIHAVKALAAYKQERGIAFYDPDREASLLEYLRRENHGPMSNASLDELMGFVLALVKREVARG